MKHTIQERPYVKLLLLFKEYVDSLPSEKQSKIAILCNAVFIETVADQTAAASRIGFIPRDVYELPMHKFTLNREIRNVDIVAGVLFGAYEQERARWYNGELCCDIGCLWGAS